MIAVLSVVAYCVGIVLGWRLGFVWGYEGKARGQMGYSYQSREAVGRERGILCALLWFVMVPALLIGKYATPTPPSLERDRQQALLDQQAKRIRDLESEAGIR